MTLKKLSNSDLKKTLNKRKENFNSYRISQGIYSIKDNHISGKIEGLIQKELKKEPSNKKKNDEIFLSNNTILSSTDTTKATKTYSEKIKNGFFGKRKARF